MLSLKTHYYTTQDVAEAVGISKLTLYRWIKTGKIQEVSKDYKHHRLFSKKDIDNIKQFKAHIQKPKSRKKTNHTKWSQEFLDLAGSWQDDRSADEIIADIYASRRYQSNRDVNF